MRVGQEDSKGRLGASAGQEVDGGMQVDAHVDGQSSGRVDVVARTKEVLDAPAQDFELLVTSIRGPGLDVDDCRVRSVGPKRGGRTWRNRSRSSPV